MTARGRALLVLALGALYSGLSLGGRIFYLSALFALLTLLFSLITVCAARRRLRVTCTLSPSQRLRGETAQLSLDFRLPRWLCVSPLEVAVQGGTRTVAFERGRGALFILLPARHVGLLSAGLSEITFSDALGLFRARIRNPQEAQPLLVLPRSFPVEPLRFQSGDEGEALQNRAAEDPSSPADTRAYRAGDPLKRVHWKLSARKRELTVRRFETPVPPDCLILTDCTIPAAAPTGGEMAARLRDALCETALSIAEQQLKAGTPVRAPLYGKSNEEFSATQPQALPRFAELLARFPFEGGGELAHILLLEQRRLRRIGATAVVTAELTADIAEAVCQIRRMGPTARLYYITATPDAPQDRAYIARLQQGQVEVCYVEPV